MLQFKIFFKSKINYANKQELRGAKDKQKPPPKREKSLLCLAPTTTVKVCFLPNSNAVFATNIRVRTATSRWRKNTSVIQIQSQQQKPSSRTRALAPVVTHAFSRLRGATRCGVPAVKHHSVGLPDKSSPAANAYITRMRLNICDEPETLFVRLATWYVVALLL